MNIKRIMKHLLMNRWQVKRAFSSQALLAIEGAIKKSEMTQMGEICFVVEGALDNGPLFKGQSARARAIDVFSQLRIWDTEHNNGALIYLLLADRDVEIIVDRGIHTKVAAKEWENICHTMELAFKEADYESGALSGIRAVTAQLEKHFPLITHRNKNELPDKPIVL